MHWLCMCVYMLVPSMISIRLCNFYELYIFFISHIYTVTKYFVQCASHTTKCLIGCFSYKNAVRVSPTTP